MNFLIGVFAFFVLYAYLWIGLYFFLRLEQTPPRAQELFPPGWSTAIAAGWATAWPVILFLLFILDVEFFSFMLNYEKRIRIFRWAVVIGVLIWLGKCGPELQRTYNRTKPNYQDEQPLTYPTTTN